MINCRGCKSCTWQVSIRWTVVGPHAQYTSQPVAVVTAIWRSLGTWRVCALRILNKGPWICCAVWRHRCVVHFWKCETNSQTPQLWSFTTAMFPAMKKRTVVKATCCNAGEADVCACSGGLFWAEVSSRSYTQLCVWLDLLSIQKKL